MLPFSSRGKILEFRLRKSSGEWWIMNGLENACECWLAKCGNNALFQPAPLLSAVEILSAVVSFTAPQSQRNPPLHTLGSIHSRLSQLRLQRLRHTVTHGEVSFKSACRDRIFFPLSGIQVSFHLGIQHGGSHKIFLCDQLGLKLFIRVYKHKPSIWWIIFWFMILFIVCTGTVFTCYKC